MGWRRRVRFFCLQRLCLRFGSSDLKGLFIRPLEHIIIKIYWGALVIRICSNKAQKMMRKATMMRMLAMMIKLMIENFL